MAPTKEETTDLVPLEQDVGQKLAEKFSAAPHVSLYEATDSREAALQIVARILDTKTLQESNEVFTGGGTSSRDLADSGKVVELRSMTIRPSDFPDEQTGQRGWYAQFDAVDTKTGEVIRISTTSRSVMAQFVAADAAGLIPARAYFVEAEKNDQGRQPIHLEWMAPSKKKK